VDVTIICVGVPALVNQALTLSRNGGRVSIFGGMKDDGLTEVSANLLHYKQVVLSGTSNCRRPDYETALRLIESGKIDAASMITHRFPLSQVHDAIDTVVSRDAIKTAVVPSDDR
jgi:L-iditol 2-dehydrogenase